MIIGPNYVYIALPRTASLSVSSWLIADHAGRTFDGHYHSADVPRECRDHLVFTVVRNPYGRMASLYRFLEQKFWGRSDEWCETAGMTMPEFVRWCIDRPEPNWQTQSQILSAYDGRLAVLRFEDFPGCLNVLPLEVGIGVPWMNRTWHLENPEEILTLDSMRAIEDHSRDDFEMFRYAIRGIAGSRKHLQRGVL